MMMRLRLELDMWCDTLVEFLSIERFELWILLWVHVHSAILAAEDLIDEVLLESIQLQAVEIDSMRVGIAKHYLPGPGIPARDIERDELWRRVDDILSIMPREFHRAP